MCGWEPAGLGEDMLGLAGADIEAAEHVLGAHDLAVGVLVLGCCADHVLLGDPPRLLGEHALEVATATRDHEYAELVRFEEVEQLEHGPINKLEVEDVELRLLGGLKPIAHLCVELLRLGPRPRTSERREEGFHRLRVLDSQRREERGVFLDERLVRRPAGERRVLLDLLGPPAEHKVELRRQGLLNPQRPVVIERRDSIRSCDERGALRRRRFDEINDGLLDWAIPPARKRCVGHGQVLCMSMRRAQDRVALSGIRPRVPRDAASGAPEHYRPRHRPEA